jgi:hypothetical protein
LNFLKALAASESGGRVMNKIIVSIGGALVLLAMTGSGYAQQRTPRPTPQPPVPAAGQTLQAPYTPTAPYQGPDQSRPLFHIGNLPAVVWAPVQPHYSSKLNSTQAGNGLMWNADAY